MRQLVAPVLIAFFITVILTIVFIPMLRRLKASNTEREDGVKEHLKKAGTPTMGGLAFLLAITITSLIYAKDNKEILPILILTLAFGIIGFIDDYLKVVLKRSDGLKVCPKFILQVIVTIGFAVYLVYFSDISLTMNIPGIGENVNLGFFAIPIMFICVLGTVNGVNFTDGVDGLASTVTIVVAICFTILGVYWKIGITPISCAVIGSLMGFLLFNSYKARIFMGDTGSLALGGFVAASVYVLRIPIFVLLIGFVYLAEVCSVIIQVTYFKKTGGKRIFKMAPIHHHFELSGWSEAKVVAVFGIVTAVLCLMSLFILT